MEVMAVPVTASGVRLVAPLPALTAVSLVFENVHALAVAAALGLRIAVQAAGFTLVNPGLKGRPGTDTIAADP